jgi:succinoglycan biosynthesis protein ExoA
MTAVPISVVIPARNEEPYIRECIEAIAAQDYPLDLVEVLVIDGASEDRTAEVAAEALAAAGVGQSKVVRNAAGTTPSNLNMGLAVARGDLLCRVDARSRIPPHYLRRCAEVLAERGDVAVVGGSQVAIASRPNAVGVGIARALNNKWTTGLSKYRRGGPSGPSDTVYLGAFRVHELRMVGGWNIDLPTNQDFDLNRRMRERGLIWFISDLEVGYVPRRSLGELFRQYVRFGQWKVRYWAHTGDRPQPRQLALASLPPLGLAFAALVLPRSRWVRRRMLPAALVMLLGTEAAGARQPHAGIAGHLAGCVAIAAVGSGWSIGLWSELAAASARDRA